jgi:hypothetical protein
MAYKNKFSNNPYTVDAKTIAFFKLIFDKGFTVSRIVNSGVGKAYTKKPIKDADKLLRVINLKKPQMAHIDIEYPKKDVFGNVLITRYGIIRIQADTNNRVIIDAIRESDKELNQLYKEADFFASIQFWE